MPWRRDLKDSVEELCRKYGRQTSQGYWWAGYGQAMAALVFEHGCPDNVPVIFWAPDDPAKRWTPLFVDRVVGAEEGSVFPSAVGQEDAELVLADVGQEKLATTGALSRRGDAGRKILLVLALIAKGQRKLSALGYATGLDDESCIRILKKCIKWEFITPNLRITKRGRAEIKAAERLRKVETLSPDRGSDYYYPQQLRGTTHG